jgi:hypothetical protein
VSRPAGLEKRRAGNPDRRFKYFILRSPVVDVIVVAPDGQTKIETS